MPPSIQLGIAQPCPASWQAMTPTGNGRHCAACQKTVVDFTRCTDAEVLAYFRQARPGGTCGRFQPAQLGRPLAEVPRRRVAWLAGLLLAALAAPGCQPALPPPHEAAEATGLLISPCDSIVIAADSTMTVGVDSVAVDESEGILGDVEMLKDK